MEPAVYRSVARRRDSRHGTALTAFSAWQGGACVWRVGVLKADGSLDDLYGVTAIILRISSYGGTAPGAFSWVDRTVPASEFLTPLSAAAVQAGIEWHAEVQLTEEETILPVNDSGTRTYWWEWRAVTAAGEVPLSAGQVVMRGTAANLGNMALASDVVTEFEARTAADAALSMRLTGTEDGIAALNDRTAGLTAAAAAAGESITALEERVDSADGLLATTDQRATVLEGRVGELSSTVQGMQVGDSYRVANLSSLPGTVNDTAATRFAEVYNDSVSSDNNGRYFNPVGSSVWSKVAGDPTGRVVKLETVTGPLSISTEPAYLPDGRLLLLSIKDGKGRVGSGQLSDGQWYSFHDHATATGSSAGFMGPDHVAKLDPLTLGNTLYASNSQILFMVGDPARRMPLYVTDDGVSHIMLADIRALIGALTVPALTIGGVPFTVRTDMRGWALAVVDSAGRIGAGLKENGDAYLPGLVIPGQEDGSITTPMLADGLITTPKLDLTLRRNAAQDYLPAMPDDVRKQLSGIGCRTVQSWHRLPDRVTPVIWGVNNSTTALEFRPTNGLLVRGQRRVGTWSPGAVPSITLRGQIRTGDPWPPAGTFAYGDYFVFTSVPPATFVIGPSTLYQGDNMVWDGGAWVFQPSPVSGTAPFYELDWWEVTVAGSFAGVAAAVGDRFVYIGYNSISGVGWHRWRVGQPKWGEFFRRGLFNPANGLPSSPVNGDMWEASASGTAGPLTFATGDTLIRTGDTWGRIAEGPSRVFANGEVIHLPCIRSAREWSMRRVDKSLTQVSVSLSGRGTRIPFRGVQDIVVYSDSLGGQPATILQATMAPRSVSARSYGGANPRDILAMFEYWISLGDPEQSKYHVIFQGRNAIADLGLIQEMADTMACLVGCGDSRHVFITPGAQRAVEWSDPLSRYIIPNMEEQLVETSGNIYAKAYRYFRDSHPCDYIDSRAVLCAAARSDYRSLEHPGKTERQVADEHGIWPIRFQRDIDIRGIDFTAIVHKGDWTLPGLPTGGSSQDFYIRKSNGRAIINVDGEWRDVNYDATHLNKTGDTGLPEGMEGGDNVIAAGIKTRIEALNH